MDIFGRFYTKKVVSNLLVNNINSLSPEKILDLGVGDASLTLAAFNRWSNAVYYATEIDKRKIKEIGEQISFINLFNYDTLNPNLSSRLKILVGSIDVAICNPPYIKVPKLSKYDDLFKEVGCEEFSKLPTITSEIVFFIHNIMMLKERGELGIILSDSLITGKYYGLFRECILSKFDIKMIIQLPDKIFAKTEARAHIVILSKSKSRNIFANLYSSDLHGNISKRIIVSKYQLAERMDYKFYCNNISNSEAEITLEDIGAQINRGKYSFKELKRSRLAYFHSTHLTETNKEVLFQKKVGKKHLSYAAQPGTILMCRVGKRCVGRVAYVKKGNAIISDCIYKINVPKKYRIIVWNSLKSIAGQKWLQAYAHGVCSQVISKSDLLKFPVDLKEQSVF